MTFYAYDRDDRKIAETDAISGIWTFGYDAAGRLITQGNPLGENDSYQYDPAGRRTVRTDPNDDVTAAEFGIHLSAVATAMELRAPHPFYPRARKALPLYHARTVRGIGATFERV
jgi:YD repeat-containing protein